MKKKPSKPKSKKTKTKAKKAKPILTLRFLNAKQQEGARHMIRVVTDCTTSHLMFDTIDDVNLFLFEFDQKHHDKKPEDTGTWIDLIVTNIQGDVFDLDQLEANNE